MKNRCCVNEKSRNEIKYNNIFSCGTTAREVREIKQSGDTVTLLEVHLIKKYFLKPP